MNKNSKLVILIILLILLFGFIAFGVYNRNYIFSNEDEENILYISDLSKTVNFQSLTFSDVLFEKQEDNSLRFTVKVTNDTDEDISISSFDVLIKDEDGKILERVTLYGGIIKSGSEFYASSSVKTSLDKIYSLEFVESIPFINEDDGDEKLETSQVNSKIEFPGAGG